MSAERSDSVGHAELGQEGGSPLHRFFVDPVALRGKENLACPSQVGFVFCSSLSRSCSLWLGLPVPPPRRRQLRRAERSPIHPPPSTASGRPEATRSSTLALRFPTRARSAAPRPCKAR